MRGSGGGVMTEGVRVKTNIADFRAQLRAIGGDFEKKAMRSATAAAASVFRAAARQAAPQQEPPSTRKGHVVGTLKRAIYTYKRKGSQGSVTYRVSIRMGKKEQAKKRDAFYWSWVEQGHVARGPGQRIKGGANSKALQRKRLKSGGGFVQAQPFLAPAFRSAGSRALQVFSERLGRAIDRYSQKK